MGGRQLEQLMGCVMPTVEVCRRTQQLRHGMLATEVHSR